MKDETKKILSAAGVYVSLIVGAGFASGQELLTFFVRFGSVGIIGLIFAGLILTISGWAVMDITHRLDIKSYKNFMTAIMGKKFGGIMVFAVNLFIFIMLATMFSGFGETLSETSNINFTVAVTILALICFIAFLFDLKGMVRINTFVAPLLVICGLFFGLYTTFTSYKPVFFNLDILTQSFLWTAIAYASYNIITAVSVLSSMREVITSPKIAKKAGLLSGLCICILGLCLIIPLYINIDMVSGLSMPMLALAQKHGGTIEIMYVIVLIAAISTSAISSGFAVIEWLSSILTINKLKIKIIVTVGGVLLAHVGFKTLIEKAYPIFGYIGLFELICINLFFLLKAHTRR